MGNAGQSVDAARVEGGGCREHANGRIRATKYLGSMRCPGQCNRLTAVGIVDGADGIGGDDRAYDGAVRQYRRSRADSTLDSAVGPIQLGDRRARTRADAPLL